MSTLTNSKITIENNEGKLTTYTFTGEYEILEDNISIIFYVYTPKNYEFGLVYQTDGSNIYDEENYRFYPKHNKREINIGTNTTKQTVNFSEVFIFDEEEIINN